MGETGRRRSPAQSLVMRLQHQVDRQRHTAEDDCIPTRQNKIHCVSGAVRFIRILYTHILHYVN